MKSFKIVCVGSNRVKKNKFLYMYKDLFEGKIPNDQYPDIWENEEGMNMVIKTDGEEKKVQFQFDVYDTSNLFLLNHR